MFSACPLDELGLYSKIKAKFQVNLFFFSRQTFSVFAYHLFLDFRRERGCLSAQFGQILSVFSDDLNGRWSFEIRLDGKAPTIWM